MAVLTDANPSTGYGIQTIHGVAERIFCPRAKRPQRTWRPAAPARPAPGRALDVPSHAPPSGCARLRDDAQCHRGRLPGYCEPWALLLRPVARDLARVQRAPAPARARAAVFDAYRPARASRALVRWARRTGRGHLVGTYIARRSNHNLGSAVDLTLVRLRTGGGCGWAPATTTSARAPTPSTRSGRMLRNRLTLVRAMERHGFTNYRREWWHFDHRVRGPRYLDISLGCPSTRIPMMNSGPSRCAPRWRRSNPRWATSRATRGGSPS